MKMRNNQSIWIVRGLFFVSILIACNSNAESRPLDLQRIGDNYRAELTVPRFVGKERVQGDETYLIFEIAGFGSTGKLGSAALPFYSFRLAIGKGGIAPDVRVVSSNTITSKLPHKLYPIQEFYQPGTPEAQKRFSIDGDYYRSAGERFELVSVSKPYVIHGVTGVTVTVHPFDYQPAGNLLSVKACFEKATLA